jgi:D-alanine-D-alanine ligase
MNDRLEYLFSNFNQEVIIEEYIDGRELNVAILDGDILPISEITFDTLPDGLPKIVTYEAKWSEDSVYYKSTIPKCPTELDHSLERKVKELARTAYEAMECRDYARVDIRLNKKNVPYVIEVNPNPDISPDTGFVRSASAAGISYEELLYRISSLALKRKFYDSQIAS